MMYLVTLPYRGQVQFLRTPDRCRAHLGHRAHCRTSIAGQNWGELVGSTAAASTRIAGAMLSNRASRSRVTPTVMRKSIAPVEQRRVHLGAAFLVPQLQNLQVLLPRFT